MLHRQRTPLVCANWKMYKTPDQAVQYVHDFIALIKTVRGVEIALAPPFTALGVVKQALQGTTVKLAAQNMHFLKEGAFTGEVSPEMVKALDCTYVIIGHSERRQHFKEDDELIQKKLRAAFAWGLVPILCVGESLSERQAGKTDEVLARQLEAELVGLSVAQVGQMVVAYEPIWAIGTGVTATPADAAAGADTIRKVISKLFGGDIAQSVRVQYGGSVKPKNIEAAKAPGIDGALVGGASLDPQAFAEIAKGIGL